MKLDHKDVINALLFLTVVILLFIIIVKIGQEGVQCTLNPLEYGANQLKELNSQAILCQGSLIGGLPSSTLYFDHNSSGFESALETGVLISKFWT